MCLELKSIFNKVILEDLLVGNYINILNKLKIFREENDFLFNFNLIGFFSLFLSDSADYRFLYILFL